MNKFEYYMPVKLLFGKGKVVEIGIQAAKFGKKALIVTGKNSTKKTGLLERVIDYLKLQGMEYEVFDRIEENPVTTVVHEGAVIANEKCCDVIIGLGGGSAIDAAKGIAFAAKNPGDISEYIFGKQGSGALPIIAVTTTAGTGTEGDSLAVLTNPQTKDKKSLKSPFIYPKVSIVDPELMKTLPKHLIASTGFDALCHVIEAYIARRANPISEALSLKAIEIINENLPKVFKNSDDIDAWGNMALANTIGGMVIDSAGVALAHGLEHSVSGLLNVRHGEGLAAIIVPFIEYSYSGDLLKFSKIAKALGEDIEELTLNEAAPKSVTAIKKFMDKIELDFSLSKLGVKQEHIDWLANNSMKTMTYAISNNPKVPTIDEIKELYMKCL